MDREGLDKAVTFNPDLIIVDLSMPVMDGFTFLKQLRASRQLQHIPAIVSSASVYEIDRQTSLKAGGDDFLPKPVRLEELLKTLEQHLPARNGFMILIPLLQLQTYRLSLPSRP